MPLGGIAKFRCLSLLKILPWGALGIPKLRLLPLRIPSSIKISPKTWKLQSHKTQQNSVRSVSIRKQITTLGTVANPFIFYSCIISTVFQLCYSLYPPKKSIEPSKQANNAKKTESVSDRTVCSNLEVSNTSITQKFMKN
jgi:hypothetical protein